MGRTPTGEPHRKPIQVKLSDEERDLLDAAARMKGLPTSTWIRLEILEVAKRRLNL